MIERPVVVVGAPRSGTSVLCRILRAHPDLGYVNEPRLVWRWGNDAKSDQLEAADATPRVVAHVRAELERMLRATGRPRLLEKTPSNALRMAFVNEVLPDARFVHIVRNGFESALSIRRFWETNRRGIRYAKIGLDDVLTQRAKEIRLRQVPHYAGELARRLIASVVPGYDPKVPWGPRLPGIERMMREMDPLAIAALQWRACVERACAFGRTLPPDRYLELRFEALDAGAIARVLAFAGLPASAEVERQLADEFVPGTAGKRLGSVSEEELRTLREALAPTMRRLGYEV